MPRPRADFECKPCQVKAGAEAPVVHENLPVTSMFCPYTGKRRGFKRLYNKVQVSTTGHRVARFIDKRLRPQADEHAKRTASAKGFERAHAVAMDKTYELAEPEVRQVLAESGAMTGGPSTPIGYGPQGPISDAARQARVGAALGSIDPAARRDSRNHTWPMVNRTVVPEWTNKR